MAPRRRSVVRTLSLLVIGALAASACATSGDESRSGESTSSATDADRPPLPAGADRFRWSGTHNYRSGLEMLTNCGPSRARRSRSARRAAATP